jgi:hypothetical protein
LDVLSVRVVAVGVDPIFRVERRGRSTERLRFKGSIRLMTFWRDGADAATFIGILD